MKYYRLAVIIGLISTLSLISSFYYYQSTRAKADYFEKKYRAVMSARSEKEAYRARLDSVSLRWASLGRLSKEKTANVNYEITLYPSDFDDLNDKIVSTYDHGFFFLKSGVLERTPEGIKLAVSGFKRGGNPQ